MYDDEEERKLSTVQELSESKDSPSVFNDNCRNRSRNSISTDSDQSDDTNRTSRDEPISCISDKVIAHNTEVVFSFNED